MPTTLEPKSYSIDRIKLPFSFDVEQLRKEYHALKLQDFIYYNVLQLRAPAHMVDKTLPPPPPADDYADGSWTAWMDTDMLKSSPYLTQVVDTFRAHTKVTLVRILRLEPGAVVKEHTDPTLGLHIDRSVIRLTIPIYRNDEVTFFLNAKPVPMLPGECWYLRLTDPHKIVNGGQEERVNITIDMTPNQWIQEIIENSVA